MIQGFPYIRWVMPRVLGFRGVRRFRAAALLFLLLCVSVCVFVFFVLRGGGGGVGGWVSTLGLVRV